MNMYPEVSSLASTELGVAGAPVEFANLGTAALSLAVEEQSITTVTNGGTPYGKKDDGFGTGWFW